MANAFHLQIISPSKIVVDSHVPEVEIPGAEGDLGVLPGHSPLLSMIRPGVIDVTQADGTHRRFFAASGYADVTPESCTVVSDHIQDLSEISVADAEEALVAARAAASNATDDFARAKAEKLLQSAEALMLAVKAA